MTRPFYWSVRRELWENRAVCIAPIAVAAVYFFGFVLSTIGMPHRRRATLMLDPEQQRAAIVKPFDILAMVLIATAVIIGVFYCLDALYGERRDRSLLFWKSLPVPDRTAVLSKIAVPLAVLPAWTFVLVVATQFVMLMWSTLVLLPSGLALSTWRHFHLITQSLILLYGLIALVLWHAPVYAWLLMISGWARRAPILWAVLPLLAVSALERILFSSTHFAKMLMNRLDFASNAFIFKHQTMPPPVESLPELTPGRFLSAPGLWIGFVMTALFLAAAVRLRRDRGSIS